MTSQKGRITEKASRCEVARGSGEMGGEVGHRGAAGGMFGVEGTIVGVVSQLYVFVKTRKAVQGKE